MTGERAPVNAARYPRAGRTWSVKYYQDGEIHWIRKLRMPDAQGIQWHLKESGIEAQMFNGLDKFVS